MSKPSITILGAGVSGLTLARLLKHRGVNATVCERDTAQRFQQRHGYGITLRAPAYRPLLGLLGLSEAEFRGRCAVDAGKGGVGGRQQGTGGGVRVNRRRLEGMLAEGLDVRWGWKVLDVGVGSAESQPADHNAGQIDVSFNEDRKLSTSLLVDATGAHSAVRKSLSPTADFTIHPYAVYNGKRRIPRQDFEDKYAPSFSDGTTTLSHDIDSTHLTLAIDDVTPEHVSVSYTYSRPARGRGDKLSKLDRPNSAATEIPEEFFHEVVSLSSSDLPSPFDHVFSPDQMRKDRLLHWLMRSLLHPHDALDSAAEKGVVWMGDAVHACPILGSEGANAGIEDAVALAEVIEGGENLKGYYKGRWEGWRKGVEEGTGRLRAMHGAGNDDDDGARAVL